MKLTRIATICVGVLSTATLASNCNQDCLSYCAYYYPSDSCIEKCECPEYAQKQKYHRDQFAKLAATSELQTTSNILATATTGTTTAGTSTTTGTTTTGTSGTTTTTTGTVTDQTKQDGAVDNTTTTGGDGSDATNTTGGDNTTTGGDSGGTNGGDGEGDGTTTDPNPPIDEDVVDPAVEESKQTCITTCNLKCKSESSAKKEDCINLCFNQCTASIALYVQEKERPLIVHKQNRQYNMLLSLNQQEEEVGSEQKNHIDDYLDDASESKLRMDDFMWMKMQHMIDDSPKCTTECVSRCGRLAELPRTQATQLTSCFEETCGCRNKMDSAPTMAAQESKSKSRELETDFMRQYFDMIHNQERVEYLILQQNLVQTIAEMESADPLFLAESDKTQIKKRLNTKDGVEYYEQYLGQSGKNQEQHSTVIVFIVHVAMASLIVAVIVLTCKYGFAHLIQRTDKQAQISFDCKQAILKKQRLEQNK